MFLSCNGFVSDESKCTQHYWIPSCYCYEHIIINNIIINSLLGQTCKCYFSLRKDFMFQFVFIPFNA